MPWKVGRVIDRAGLEIRYTPFGYRGFESLTFRQRSSTSHIVGLFFVVYSIKSKKDLEIHSLIRTFAAKYEDNEEDTDRITGYCDVCRL